MEHLPKSLQWKTSTCDVEFDGSIDVSAGRFVFCRSSLCLKLFFAVVVVVAFATAVFFFDKFPAYRFKL